MKPWQWLAVGAGAYLLFGSKNEAAPAQSGKQEPGATVDPTVPLTVAPMAPDVMPDLAVPAPVADTSSSNTSTSTPEYTKTPDPTQRTSPSTPAPADTSASDAKAAAGNMLRRTLLSTPSTMDVVATPAPEAPAPAPKVDWTRTSPAARTTTTTVQQEAQAIPPPPPQERTMVATVSATPTSRTLRLRFYHG